MADLMSLVRCDAIGRVEVHSHLLPAVDDGCRTLEESVACARKLVGAGYTHAFCTPHVLPQFPQNTIDGIAAGVQRLQRRLNSDGVPLVVMPGGELTLARSNNPWLPRREEVVTYGLRGRWVLFDFWESDPRTTWERLEREVGHLRSLGFELICAHPERAPAIQREPALLDRIAALGVRLQLNSWCLCDAPGTPTRDLAQRWLREGRYWITGMDIHGLEGMGPRLAGLVAAGEIVGSERLEALLGARARELM
jgi:tyrosine-protein phosphatase YwqE